MESYVSEATLFQKPAPGARGWHVHSYNDDVDATLEIMAPTFGTTYAQLAANDLVEGDSDQAGDTTQKLSVWGINSAGKKAEETISLNGTTAVNGTVTWSYIENIRANALSAGIMFLSRDTGNTYIMEIEAGFLTSSIAQHFNGEDESYITFFGGGLYDTTDDCLLELRWYPDDSSCRGTSTGYEVLDRIFTPLEVGSMPPHIYPQPIGPLPPGGWIVVYAAAASANAKAYVTLQGFDMHVGTNR